MIKASELRIGNFYIDICGSVGKWDISCYSYYKHHPLDGENKYKKLKGILLTPEILEKAGAEKHGEWFIIKSPASYELSIHISFSHNKTTIGANEEYEIPHLQYVHDLQNFYFAINREELKLRF